MTEPTQVIEDCSPLLVATSPRSDLSRIDPVLAAMLKTVCETIGWVVLVFFQSEARDVDPQGIELTESIIAQFQSQLDKNSELNFKS